MTAKMNETLKNDNIQAVFRAVVDEGCETRSEIAESTGLSIVTAGKAVEAFLDTDIFVQKTKQAKTVGRHAGRILPNPGRNITVMDLSKRNFQLLIYDLTLSCVYTNEYEYISDFSYSENLCMFLHRVKAYMLGTKGIRYNTVAIVVPGSYDHSSDTVSGSRDEEIERLKIRDFAKSMAGMPVDIVLDHVSAALRYCSAKCRQDMNILYINTDDGINARLIMKGRALKRSSASGAIPPSGRGAVEDLCGIISCICNIAGINEVIIESEELGELSDPGETIRVKLEKTFQTKIYIPKISVNSPVKYACCGTALLSRNYWLDNILR
jgi:hypothetical protein